MLGISARRLLLVLVLCLVAAPAALAQSPHRTPCKGRFRPARCRSFRRQLVEPGHLGGSRRPNSASYIAFINNGGTRRLHPDFGGEASPGSVDDLRHALCRGRRRAAEAGGDVPVLGRERRRRSGDRPGLPVLPDPGEAITQPHWVEGGAPGNVDQRSASDRHLLIVDCTNKHLYELYNVCYDAAQRVARGLGRVLRHEHERPPARRLDLGRRGRPRDPSGPRPLRRGVRPAAPTSATRFASPCARPTATSIPLRIGPGRHAGALPMGARLRLKASVSGRIRRFDQRSELQKIFRAMKKHG